MSWKTKLSNQPEYRKRYQRKRRLRLKANAVSYKGSACNHCGWSFEVLEVFEFHHPDPSEKDFHISNKSTCSWKKVKKELDKCIMLCANCHRIEHDRIKTLESST